MSSTYGENLKLSIFGQSHSPAIGMVLDGIPAGLPVDTEQLKAFLARRAPGQGDWTTSRKEADTPEFLGGIVLILLGTKILLEHLGIIHF